MLTKEQFNLVRKIRNRTYINDKIKNTNYCFDLPVNHMPMQRNDEPKRRFMPSKMERLKIKKIIKALKNGWIKPR